MKINRIEILAPAGSFESVIAAVRSGADAVYVGGKKFSARASAQNFDENELKKAAAYCHIHGVKIYVALNTIVFDDEFEELKDAIISAAKADADALIVQNIGVAEFARRLVPKLPLHASTQMSVHTVSGVKALYELGFKRVVLSREMSREEIKAACKIPIEIEVFVHGALCMSVSGQCYFSAVLGSRSGNRGACAQTCRLPFSTCGSRSGHALSLKDNSLTSYMDDLMNIGVASAKIEGRMKRPEYVCAAVRACKEQRDNGFISDDTQKILRAVFSRTGFTDGYYTGKSGKSMFGTRTKDDVVSADKKLLSQIRSSYKDEIGNVAVRGHFTAKQGKAPCFCVTDGTNSVSVRAEKVCESALSFALQSEKCRRQLSKTGGTAYHFTAVDCDIDENISLPVSALNHLRRAALEKLDELRSTLHNYEIADVSVRQFEKHRPSEKKFTRIRVTDTTLSPEFTQAELVFVPLFSDIDKIDRLIDRGFCIGAEIPRGMFGKEKQIENRLSKIKEIGVTDVLCNNIGALYTAKQLGFTLHAGFGLNLVNTYDLLWAEKYGITDAELSFELTFERIKQLGGNIPRGIISYGFLPLMLCRNCPNKSSGIECSSCKNRSKLTDRKGMKFPLQCDGICTEILNCVPLFVSYEEISKLPVNFNILRFSVENYVETVETIRGFNSFSMLKDKTTHGLYKRGVN